LEIIDYVELFVDVHQHFLVIRDVQATAYHASRPFLSVSLFAVQESGKPDLCRLAWRTKVVGYLRYYRRPRSKGRHGRV
jgi:hypothetical protein